MREIHALLKESFLKTASKAIVAQGESSRTELLDRFRKLGNAVLVGSQSFWKARCAWRSLKLVIIDKLPFARQMIRCYLRG